MKRQDRSSFSKLEAELTGLWAKVTDIDIPHLTELDVLSCILFIGMGNANTTRLAYSLLEKFGDFANILSAPAAELLSNRGMTISSVLALKAVRLSSIYLLRTEVVKRPFLGARQKLEEYLIALLSRETVEQSRVIFLDSRHRLLGEKILSKGTINHVSVYPREAIKEALALNATAILLVHNHPSGNPSPSDEDIDMTEHFRNLCKELGIKLHDHIIVANGLCFSLIRDGSHIFPAYEGPRGAKVSAKVTPRPEMEKIPMLDEKKRK